MLNFINENIKSDHENSDDINKQRQKTFLGCCYLLRAFDEIASGLGILNFIQQFFEKLNIEKLSIGVNYRFLKL